jgi:transposase
LPPRLKAEIARELQRQELIVGMLKETERDAIAAAENNAKKVQDLVKLKAIGPEIASVLTGEVLYRSFDNRHQVASYASL